MFAADLLKICSAVLMRLSLIYIGKGEIDVKGKCIYATVSPGSRYTLPNCNGI
jgi:hypothetical protein